MFASNVAATMTADTSTGWSPRQPLQVPTLFKQVACAMVEFYERSRQRAFFGQLDEHLLQDIGLTRTGQPR